MREARAIGKASMAMATAAVTAFCSDGMAFCGDGGHSAAMATRSAAAAKAKARLGTSNNKHQESKSRSINSMQSGFNTDNSGKPTTTTQPRRNIPSPLSPAAAETPLQLQQRWPLQQVWQQGMSDTTILGNERCEKAMVDVFPVGGSAMNCSVWGKVVQDMMWDKRFHSGESQGSVTVIQIYEGETGQAMSIRCFSMPQASLCPNLKFHAYIKREKRMPGPVEATSSTLEVAQDDNERQRQSDWEAERGRDDRDGVRQSDWEASMAMATAAVTAFCSDGDGVLRGIAHLVYPSMRFWVLRRCNRQSCPRGEVRSFEAELGEAGRGSPSWEIESRLNKSLI
nr:hypothetical protein Iba_chr10dCG9510 [Ipomoea batatas]